MTTKQEKIIQAALTLFAKEGFRSTPTSKVAKVAGVSEGLIFRHFGNKEGLLEAIVQLGEERAKALFSEIIAEPDPKELIRKFIEMPLKLSEEKEKVNFWKLQFKLKWEMEIYNEKKLEGIESALYDAFTKLKYFNPEEEANLLLTMMDGLATRYILQQNYDLESTIDVLKKKYKV